MSKTARSLDQFFTRREVAQACVAAVRAYLPEGDWTWIEPSAGEGAFLDAFPAGGIALDIAPRRPDVAAADFLGWIPPANDWRVVVVGNPPFGRNASLARRFFDHAASFAEVVAMIVPRTFQKPGFVDRLDRRMQLVEELMLEPRSFELSGKACSVPTVFQIWRKGAGPRALNGAVRSHPDFAFVSREHAQFAFQRVGARAGLASVDGLAKSAQSHYFLRAADCPDRLLARLRTIDWAPIRCRTAGNPSISRGELVAAYRAAHG